MKYLCFIRHSEKYREAGPPAGLMDAMGAFVQRGFKEGTLVDAGGLKASKDGAARIQLSNGKITVTDGPFSESKEIIGGWAIIKADTRAKALEISTELMALHQKYWPGFEGESEMRPMFEPGEGP